ncbi:putative lipid-binding transport protein (Tim44 family) [Streptomyces sp. LBL]|uniref:DUF2637 domain-containing protein n=1 Tax=Streptomyces sp. LBL TaxID=2940562 RepID=UPI002473AC68|nr:DUF2637 domain-containing protein [Streptomyces sp. LBL]MDH6625791.1 putative lipid-binding transport protein (Tim44 family) [Streptomyces sp. LBL]
MREKLRDPILIQAVIAAALSFAHIHDIAEAAGQGGWKAWAYPVSVDLLMVMAWKQIRTADGASKAAPWVWFVVSLAASLGANIATAGVLDLDNLPVGLRVLVAGWPAVAFLGGSLLVHSRKAHAEEPQEPAEEPAGEPDEEVDLEPEKAAQKPNLVTYAEAAAVAGVKPETIRGAANGDSPRLVKHQTYEGPRVDLDEVRKVYNLRPVGV